MAQPQTATRPSTAPALLSDADIFGDGPARASTGLLGDGDVFGAPASRADGLLSDDDVFGKPEPVAFGSIARGWNRLQQAGATMAGEIGLMSPEDVAASIAADEADLAQYPVPEGVQKGLGEILDAEGISGAARAIWRNLGVLPSVIGESLPMALPGIAIGAATAPLGGVGAVGGIALGSGVTEYADSLLGYMRDQGIDPNDAGAVAGALRNPEFMAEARTYAAKRGMAIGTFDALTAGLAGRVGSTILRAGQTARRVAGAGAATAGIEAAGGAGGEAAAQLATDGQINPGSVALEGIAEVVPGMGEAAIAAPRSRAGATPSASVAYQVGDDVVLNDGPIDGVPGDPRHGQSAKITRAGTDANGQTRFELTFEDGSTALVTDRLLQRPAGAAPAPSAETPSQPAPVPGGTDPADVVYSAETEPLAPLGGRAQPAPVTDTGATASPVERATLRRAGNTDDEIDAMSPAERANDVAQAARAGVSPSDDDVAAARSYEMPAARDAVSPRDALRGPITIDRLADAGRAVVQDMVAGRTTDAPSSTDRIQRGPVATRDALLSDADVFGLPNTRAPEAATMPAIADPREVGSGLDARRTMPPASDAPTPAEPERTRAPIARRVVSDDTALTSSGREVPVQYAVVEAADLITSQRSGGGRNPDYPSELQPRDRTRATSQKQISDIAQNLQPRLLDQSPRASDGAPIIAPDGVVESGNGRVMALRRVYARDQEAATRYRDYLAQQGYPVDGMSQPVLVRVRGGELDADQRQAFTREANERDTLAMSATERAMADAAALSPGTLALYRGGDIDLAGNRDFVRAFSRQVVGANEQAAMVDATGALSQEAARRMQGALLAKAYGAADVVASLIESTDTNIRAIGGALMDVAGEWAQMRTEAANGTIATTVDQTSRLLDAVRTVQRARAEGRALALLVGQRDIFSGSAMHPVAEAFLRLMFRNTASWTMPMGRERLADALRFYIAEARKTQPGIDLLGEPAPGADRILKLAEDRQRGPEQDQQAGFAFGGRHANVAAGPDAGARREGGAVEDQPRPQAARGESPARESGAAGQVAEQARVRLGNGETREIGGGILPRTGLAVANAYADGQVYIGRPGEQHFTVHERYPHADRGDPEATGFVTPDGQFLNRAEALAWTEAQGQPVRPSSNMGRNLDALDYREQVQSRGRPSAERPGQRHRASDDVSAPDGGDPFTVREGRLTVEFPDAFHRRLFDLGKRIATRLEISTSAAVHGEFDPVSPAGAERAETSQLLNAMGDFLPGRNSPEQLADTAVEYYGQIADEAASAPASKTSTDAPEVVDPDLSDAWRRELRARSREGGEPLYALRPSGSQEDVPVIDVTAKFDGSDFPAERRRAQLWAKANIRGKFRNAGTGWDIEVGANGIKKSTSGVRVAADLDALQAVPELLRTAAVVDSTPGNREGIVASHRLVGAISIAGRLRRVLVTVLEDRDGHRFYDQHSTDEGPAGLAEGRPALRSGTDQRAEARPTVNVGALLDGVKPAANADTAELGDALRAELDRLGLADVGLRLVDKLEAMVDGTLRQADASYYRGLVDVALDTRNPMAAVRHEAIHALRDLRLFGQDEWAALSRRAESDWLQRFDIARRYGELNREERIEEAVAAGFAEWAESGKKPLGLVGRAFERIRNFFTAMRNALSGAGFLSDADVFRAVASGEVGGRSRSGEAAGSRPKHSITERFPDVPPRDAPKAALTRRISAALQSGVRAVKKASPGDRATADDGETIGDYLHRKLVDYLHPLRMMQEKVGAPLTELNDAYMTARLAEDTALAAIQTAHDKYVTPMVDALVAGKASLEDLHRFLYAQHAEERNRVVGFRNPEGSDLHKAATDPSVKGASGMSTNEARQIIADLRKDAERFAALRKAAAHVRAMLDKSLRDQRAAGLIDAETFKLLTEQWEHYVPLKGQDGMDEDGWRPVSAGGFDVRGDEFKAATGRFTEADNVIANAVHQVEQSIFRAKKNDVGKAMLRFLNQFDPKGERIAQVYWSGDGTLGDITKAKDVHRRTLDKDGKVTSTKVPNPFRTRDDVLATKIGGKSYYIRFADPKVGHALRKLGMAEIDALSKMVRKVSVWQSIVNTRANPAFTPINIIRDLQTGAVHLLDEGFTASDIASVVSNVPKAWGALWRQGRGRPGAGEWDRAAKEYFDAGGKITFHGYATMEESLAKLQSDIAEGLKGGTSAKAVGKRILKFVGDLNDAGENGIRLAAYVAARKKMSPKQAAFLARDLTVDFKKHGELGPLVNSWYVFFNAALQGNYNIARRMARSKKVQAAVGAFIFAGVMQSVWNSLAAGEDDDGESYYTKMLRNEPYKLERQFVFFLPGSDKYVSFPMPYGYNAFHHLGVQSAAVMSGDKTPLEAIADGARVAFDAFNPIGSGSIANMISPTITDPAIELYGNENFFGAPIYPEENPFDKAPPPDSSKSFSSTHPAFKWLAEQMNAITGGSSIEPGAVDIHPDTLEHLWGFFTGGIGRFGAQATETVRNAASGEFEPKTTPWVRSFYGAIDEDSQRSEYFRQRESVLDADGRLSEYEEAGTDAEIADFMQRRAVDIDAIGAFKAAEKARRKINKLRRELESLPQSADIRDELKRLDEDELAIMKDARRAYAAARRAYEQRAAQ